MKRLISIITLVLFVIAVSSTAALADHKREWKRERIAVAAHELDDAASHFYKVTKHLSKHSHISKDAKKLDKAAHHFHKRVERGVSYKHLAKDFYDLEYSYRHLTYQLRYARHSHHNPHFMRDWNRVEQAWERLSRSMKNGFDYYSFYY